jgi:hypothetical protein
MTEKKEIFLFILLRVFLPIFYEKKRKETKVGDQSK